MEMHELQLHKLHSKIMNEIHVYGASDDLIEITGDVSDEFYANYGEPTKVKVGNTILLVTYDKQGEWRIETEGSSTEDWVTIYNVGAEEAEQYKDYSDLAVVETEGAEVTKLE